MTEVTAADGAVTVRKSAQGDAFVRWGGPKAKPLPMDAAHNAVAVTFSAFPDQGSVAGRIAFFGAGGKYLGTKPWLPRTSKPGRYLLDDIRVFAQRESVPEPTHWQLFLRVTTGPPGGFTIDRIEVDAALTESAANPEDTAAPGDALDSVSVIAMTTEPIPVIYEDQEKAASLRLTSAFSADLELKVSADIIDYDGQVVGSTAQRITLPKGEALDIALPAQELTRGFYYIDYTLSSDGRERNGQTRLAVLPRVERPTPGEGIHYHLATGHRVHVSDHFDKAMSLLEAGGFRGVRFHWKWEQAERHQGRWNFEPMDLAVQRLRDRGVVIQHILAYNTPWEAPDIFAAGGDWRMTPPDPTRFAEYVRRTVERYHNDIKYWEIWNEPDLTNFWRGDAEQYIELLRVSHDIIKSIDPEAVVLTGGFATLTPHGGRKHPHLQRDVLRDAYDSFDVHAFHQHGRPEIFTRIVEGPLKKVRSVMPSQKPLWFNETATTTGRLPRVEGERQQAETAIKKLAISLSHGAIGYTWYNLRESIYPSGRIRSWGVVTNDFEPKPVLVAFNTWIREVGDRPFAGRLDVGEDNYVHLWGSGERRVITAWSLTDRATRSIQTVRVNEGATVTLIDAIGREQALPVREGRFVLPVDKTPVFVRLEQLTTDPALEPAVLRVPGPVVVYGQTNSDIVAEAANPWDRPLTVTAGSGTNASQIVLGPGEQRQVRLPVVLAADADRRFGDSIGYALNVRIDKGWEETLDLPLVAGALIPAGAWDQRDPDFDLDDRNGGEVVNRFDYAPAHRHFVWQGPKDVSAKAWLTHEDGAIRLRIDVRDDAHAQAFDAENLWQGDSVQIGLAAANAEDFHEIGIATTADGRVLVHAWRGDMLGPLTDLLKPKVSDLEEGKRYELRLPLKALGLTPQDLRRGIRFNLVVNDNDGEAREGWCHIAPGLAEDKALDRFPLIRFE
ncbi:MAG: hypothetical protein AAF797_00670 [Planctomycetota bacterium]